MSTSSTPPTEAQSPTGTDVPVTSASIVLFEHGRARVGDQLLALLDARDTGIIIGLFGSRDSNRSSVLNSVIAPASGHRARTPEHRKVMGLTLKATSLLEDKSPWQRLVLAVLELLSANAMPGDRKAINDLRNELIRTIRVGDRNDDGDLLASAAFAHHFRATFPRLVQNVFALSNAVLAVGIEDLDDASPEQAAQWLEAAGYFLIAPGCAVIVTADESELCARLEQAVPGAGGAETLQKWVKARLSVQSIEADKPAPATRPSAATPGLPMRDVSDVPAPCLHIITSALEPDRRLTMLAVENWRAAMRAVVKRNEDSFRNPLSATAMAKLAALRHLSPQLFDVARYDPRRFVAIERQTRGEMPAEIEDEWLNAVNANPRVKALLAGGPELSSIELRDLAAAFRLIHVSSGAPLDNVRAVESPLPNLTASQPASALEPAHEAGGELALAPQTAGSFAVPLTVSTWMTLLVAGGVVLADQMIKLLAIGLLRSQGPLKLGEAFSLALAPTGFGGTSTAFDVLGVGSELFGVALAVLIILFWGGSRSQKSYSVGFGLILGALLSNLFDRLVYGTVVNFIQISALPVFNVAQIALLLGGVLLAFSLVRHSLSRS